MFYILIKNFEIILRVSLLSVQKIHTSKINGSDKD